MSPRPKQPASAVGASEQLRLLVRDQSEYAIFLLDPEGHVRTWNRGAERLKGYTADQIVGSHFSCFYPPDAVAAGHPQRVLDRAREHGRHEEEGWRVRRDGSRFWANIVLTALRDERGTLLGFGKVTRDLTSRRRAEEELRRNAADLTAANAQLEQFRLLVASVRDYAIFVLDPGGHIRTWNAGAEHIKGYTPEEAIGRHFSLFYTKEARDRDHPGYELQVAARVGRFEEEGWRVRKDGTMFWANVVITALRDEREELVGYAKVTRDLTERREAEEQLRRSSEELTEAYARLEESEREARAEAARQRRRTAAIELVGRAIVARLELDAIVQTATDAATDLTGAQLGAFFYDVTGEDGETPRLFTVSGVPRETFEAFPLPRDTELFAPTFRGEAIIRSDDVTQDPRFGRSEPFLGLPEGHPPVRSYLAVPVLTSAGEVAGGMIFGHSETGVFDLDDEAAAVSIAASAAVAISNARLLDDVRRESAARQAALEQRDRVARALQASLLPPDLPIIPGIEIGARYHAGTEMVGGDFYDVFSLGGGAWGVVLGDVCGSGPEAASQTALTRHAVRTAAMFDPDPQTVLQALNTALVRAGADRFTTAVYALLTQDEGTGAVRVRLASGGHPPPLVARAGGTVSELPSAGALLGVFPSVELTVTETVLDPGDTLVLYTDGLVEARRTGELFGHDRLEQAVAWLHERPADDLADSLVAAALEHVDGPVSDDIAVVVLRPAAG